MPELSISSIVAVLEVLNGLLFPAEFTFELSPPVPIPWSLTELNLRIIELGTGVGVKVEVGTFVGILVGVKVDVGAFVGVRVGVVVDVGAPKHAWVAGPPAVNLQMLEVDKFPATS